MALRAQLPARSPLSAAALAAGFRAARRGGEEDSSWLRERLLERYGAREALLVDSGTTALRLALQALARGGSGSASGPPVALPAYSCYDVATAAVGAGVPVRLYDVDPRTLGPEPGSLERALEEGAGAVVLAPLYGVPVDAAAVEARCAERGVLVVEDAAQGSGATYGGAPVGSRGSLAVLSFGRGKGWTGGGGGALLANDEIGAALLETVAELPAAGGRGWNRVAAAAAQWVMGRPALYGLPKGISFLRLGDTVYREPWTPARFPPAAAGVLRATEGAARTEEERRRANAARLLASIRAGGRLGVVEPPPGSEPGWLRLPVLLPERGARTVPGGERVLLPEELGVYTGYPVPLNRLRALAALRERPGEAPGHVVSGSKAGFPGAETLSVRLATLPTHGGLRPQDLDALEAWIRSV